MGCWSSQRLDLLFPRLLLGEDLTGFRDHRHIFGGKVDGLVLGAVCAMGTAREV